MKRCPKCHYPNDNENKFCRECGTELIGIKNYCPYCDKLYSLGEKFCVECGTKLVVKPSHTKPKPQTSSRPKPQSQPKISTPQNKEDNIRKVSSDNYIINLKKNTNVKSKVNNNTGVYMSEEANPYSKLTDSELIKKLEIAKNRHADAIKARDASAQRYMAEIKAIEKVLSTRHEKPKENTPVKTKKGTNHKNTNYKEFQRLFINSPVETDILLKEVFGYAHFPEENDFNIIIKYYGANKLKKVIKNAERRIEEKK